MMYNNFSWIWAQEVAFRKEEIPEIFRKVYVGEL